MHEIVTMIDKGVKDWQLDCNEFVRFFEHAHAVPPEIQHDLRTFCTRNAVSYV